MEQTATPISAFGKMQSAELPTLAPIIRYCIYARKSTEQDEKQALSIDSQIKEMLKIAERDRLDIADIRKESHSAKDSGQRPVFNQLIADVKSGKFNGILTWAPDRLSRNAGDLGALVDLMDQKLIIEIRTFGQKFTNSPNEKFLLMILGAQGKLENDQKGLNVKRGQRARCEMGLWPAPAPTGYLNNPNRDKKCHVIVDPQRASAIKQMFEKVGYERLSGRQVYKWLKDNVNFKTVNGKHLTLSNVYIILKSHFYYGTFEYPKKSGNWYTGKHESLISKDLFDKVQEQIKRSDINIPYASKEFAFTKLITCGLCGSGISATERIKKQQNGNVHQYIYYGCTKFNDKECKCGYIREDELINQFLSIIDTMKLDKTGIKEKVEQEVERYHRFRNGVLGMKDEEKNDKEISIRQYAKYILKEGSAYEKRDLLSCLRSKLTLKNKQLTLAE